jgi:type III secretory pathway component EscS
MSNQNKENALLSSLKYLNNSAKETTEYINGPSVSVKYNIVPSLLASVIGEEEMNDFKIGAYILLLLICIITVSIILLLSYIPAIYSFQSETISFYFKLLLLLSIIISPYYIYPILVMFMGPYQIYAGFITLYYCGLPYMLRSIFQYKKLNIEGLITNGITFNKTNMGTILGILFILGWILQSGLQGYNWFSYLFPTIAKEQIKTKKNEVVSEFYYKQNKDKIFYS